MPVFIYLKTSTNALKEFHSVNGKEKEPFINPISTDTKRLLLLSEAEIEEMYSIPQFNRKEREYYFSLNKDERCLLRSFSNTKVRLYFILQLGYFKATQQFFTFNFEDVKADVRFVLQTCLHVNGHVKLRGNISRKSNQKQREYILKFFCYNAWSEVHRPRVEAHLCNIIRIHPKSHNAFRELLVFFETQKITIPSYRTFQDIFTKAFSIEQKRTRDLVFSIPKYLQNQLFELVHNEDGLTQLNLMRADQKDFQFTALRREILKVQKIFELYLFCKSFTPKLEISKNSIRYYADLTEQYPPARLRDMSKAKRLLHLICFVYHRYQQFMDNMIITFIYHVRALLEAGKAYSNMAFLQHGAQFVGELPKVAQFLKWFPNQESNPKVTYIEFSQEAYKILPKNQFEPLAKFIEGRSFDKDAAKWEFYKKSSRMFSLYLRPILLAVDFDFYKEDSSIMKLIHTLKEHYGSGKPPSSLRFTDDLGFILPRNIVPYLKSNPTDKKVDPHLLEFFVYKKIYHHFGRGRMFCNNSVSFKDLNHDLVADELVDNAENIIDKFGHSKITVFCDEHLDHMIKSLDIAWSTTLQNIDSGKNKGIELKQNKGKIEWRLLYDPTPKQKDSFFDNLPQVEISNLVQCIGNLVGFWKGFRHSKDRYVKRKEPSPTLLNAGIIAEAFGIGSEKLSEMSDINYVILRSISKNFITIENLSHTNDLVSNYIYSLPIFKEWNLLDNKVLADADGQKFSTSFNIAENI